MFAGIARGQIEYQINSVNPYTDFTRGALWGSGVNNAWTTNTLAVDEGICLSITNNNPSSSHTVNVTVFGTLDQRATSYLTPTPYRWGQATLVQNGGATVSGLGFTTIPVTVNAQSVLGLYVRTAGAARMSFLFAGSTTAAGNPDTADIFVTHNVTGFACGSAVLPASINVQTVNQLPTKSQSGGIPIEVQQTPIQSASWTSATVLNTTLPVNVTGFSNSTVTFHSTGAITGGGAIFEASDDGTNFYAITCFPTGTTGGATAFTASSNTYAFVSGAQMFDCPNYGTVQFRVRLNPVITGAGTELVNITNSAISPSTNTVQSVLSAQSSTAFSTLPFDNNGANLTTAVTVKGTQGNLYGWYILNTTAAVCYLQLFNNAAPVLGTTVPAQTYGIPANGGANQALSIPIGFSTAIAAAATTTPAGNTTCAMTVNLWFL